MPCSTIHSDDTSREAFERFWTRSRGERKHRELIDQRREDGSYVSDSAQRHWWTWQNAMRSTGTPPMVGRAFALADEAMFELLLAHGALHGNGIDSTVIGFTDEASCEVMSLTDASEAMRDCLVVYEHELDQPWNKGRREQAAALPALRPRHNGDYTLPAAGVQGTGRALLDEFLSEAKKAGITHLRLDPADCVPASTHGAFLDPAAFARALMTPEQLAEVRRGFCPKCSAPTLGEPVAGAGVEFRHCTRCSSVYADGVPDTGRRTAMADAYDLDQQRRADERELQIKTAKLLGELIIWGGVDGGRNAGVELIKLAEKVEAARGVKGGVK